MNPPSLTPMQSWLLIAALFGVWLFAAMWHNAAISQRADKTADKTEERS